MKSTSVNRGGITTPSPRSTARRNVPRGGGVADWPRSLVAVDIWNSKKGLDSIQSGRKNRRGGSFRSNPVGNRKNSIRLPRGSTSVSQIFTAKWYEYQPPGRRLPPGLLPGTAAPAPWLPPALSNLSSTHHRRSALSAVVEHSPLSHEKHRGHFAAVPHLPACPVWRSCDELAATKPQALSIDYQSDRRSTESASHHAALAWSNGTE